MGELFLPGDDDPFMEVDHEVLADRVTPIVVNPHPFRTDFRTIPFIEGVTIAEIVEASGIPAVYHGMVRVWIADHELPRDRWRVIRPKPGAHVYVRVMPQGGGGGDGGGKSMLSSVLMLAVVFAAAWAAPALTGMLLPGAASTSFGFIATKTLIGAGIALVGSLIVSALIPPPGPDRPGQMALLSGVQNQFAPYAQIPRHFGTRRVYPLQAARPYTEAQGKDRYLRALLLVGYGPLKISEIKIGDTAIENYEAVTYQTREGWSTDQIQFGLLGLNTTAGATQEFGASYSGTIANCTSAVVNGRQRYTATGTTPVIDINSLSLVGANNRWVRFRFRVIGDPTGHWRGYAGWKTAGHGYSVSSYGAFTADPTLVDGQWVVMEWDMHNAVNGGADWLASTITGIRFAVFDDIGTVFEVDYMECGSRRGTDSEQTLFTKTVDEETFDIELDQSVDGSGVAIPGPGAWYVRTTEPDTTEVSVDFAAVSGWGHFKDNGDIAKITQTFEVQYSVAGAASWSNFVWDGPDEADGTLVNGEVKFSASSRTPIIRGGRMIMPSQGQWDIRCRRAAELTTPTDKYAQEVHWTTLRSIKPFYPVQIPGMALIALKMKMTDQLSGLPDEINCMVESYLPQYHAGQWLFARTRAPAWAYADILRRRGTDRLIADSRIDVAEITDWARECDDDAPASAEEAWQMDASFEGGTVYEVSKNIAAYGRAAFGMRNGKYSIVRDIPQTVPVQHFTPSNSSGYSGSRVFIDRPHALRITFTNAAKGYQSDEVIVYADGYDETTATLFETIQMPFCPSPDQAWREGRYHLAVGELRPDEHTINVDVEQLRCSQGSLVLFSHDVLSIGTATGRIVAQDIGRNRLTYTDDFSNWTNNLATITANAVTAPDGSHLADQIDLTSSTACQITENRTATGTKVFSVWLRGVTAGQQVKIGGWNATNGYVTQTISMTTSWVRYSVSGSVTAATDWGLFSAGVAASFYAWGAQMEDGSAATDYQHNPASVQINGKICGYFLSESAPFYAGTDYSLRARLSDGTSVLYPLQPVYSASETDYVALATALTAGTGAAEGDLFMLGETSRETAPMIVKKILSGKDLTAQIVMVDAQSGVWTADQGTIPPFQTFINDDTPLAQQIPPAPSYKVKSDESVVLRLTDGTLQDRIAVTLGTIPSSKVPITSWQVQWKSADVSEWDVAATVSVSTKTVYLTPVLAGGLYDIRCCLISKYLRSSLYTTTLGHQVVGKTSIPAAVVGFTATGNVDGAQLQWDANTEVDVAGYTIKRGTEWNSAVTVSDSLSGTSLFVALDLSTPQTFLIRAVDVLGNLSASSATATATVTRPDNVTTFNAYPQHDNVRFTWAAVPGRSIEYEIRCGTDWASGQRVTRSAGTSTTVKWPARTASQTSFWIKAVNAAGLYSATARFASASLASVSNRNVVLDLDLSTSTWPGNRIHLDNVGFGTGSQLAVTQGADGFLYETADYFVSINLGNPYTARAWIVTALILTASTITWRQGSDTWDAASEQTWDGVISDEEFASLTPYIAVKDATYVDAALIENFPLNGTTTGSAGTVPSINIDSYGTLHYQQGLQVDKSFVTWNTLSIPSTFSVIWDFRFEGEVGSYTPFMFGFPADPLTDPTPADAAWGDFGLFNIKVNSSGNAIYFVYDSASDSFACSAATGVVLYLPSNTMTGDRLVMAMSQAATSRTFMLYNCRTGEVQTATDATGTSLGTLTWMRSYIAGYRRAPGVLGNIEFRSRELSATEFSEMAPGRTAPGYRPFQELVPGDYTFQEAAIWLAVDVVDRAMSFLIDGALLYVDVSDVPQRGNASIGTSGTTITFPTAYTVAPEVQVTQTGGATVAIVQVTNLTATSFKVTLYDAASPATKVAGTVSWASNGY